MSFRVGKFEQNQSAVSHLLCEDLFHPRNRHMLTFGDGTHNKRDTLLSYFLGCQFMTCGVFEFPEQFWACCKIVNQFQLPR